MADDIRKCGELDERLAPYVDGEDTPAAHAAVDRHVGACPPCREQVQAETAAREMVRAHKDALCAHAPDTLRARCRQSAASLRLPTSAKATAGEPASSSGFARSPFAGSRVRTWLPLSLAATLVLAVAGVFLFGLNDRVEALAASLAVDHIKCFKVEGTDRQTQPAVAERAWQQDQGWPISVPPAESAEQLKLVGIRRCFTTDGRSAHIMYTWRGAPLSVYILQTETKHDRVIRKIGTEAVIWCANRRTYAVVAGDDTRDLTQIVNYMKARVR